MQVTYDLSILFHCALKAAWHSSGIDFCIYNRHSWLTVSSYTMVAQQSIRGYFGALLKQQKRKGNPSAENTLVIEKKHCDSPMV